MLIAALLLSCLATAAGRSLVQTADGVTSGVSYTTPQRFPAPSSAFQCVLGLFTTRSRP